MEKLEVRWHDGYLERFHDVENWRCGYSTLWIKHITGEEEWIPLVSVRRFSFSKEHP
jgi:hypothetical protein